MKYFSHVLHLIFLSLFLGIDDPGAGGGSGGGAGAAGGASGGSGGAAGSGAGTGGQAGPILDAQGNFVKGWSAQFGVDATLEQKFTSPKALAGSYASLEKMISAKGIIPPGPNATPEQIDAYHKALGRPDKPEEYALAAPQKIKVDGKEVEFPAELWDKDSATAAATLFHKLGLTKAQAEAIVAFDLERGVRSKGSLEAGYQKSVTEATNALKSEWGADFDAKLTAAKETAAKLGMPADALNDPAIANNPHFIKVLAKVADLTKENPAAGGRASKQGSINPDAEIAAIMADKNHPWHPHNAKLNPKAHADAVKHMQSLYKLKHGEA